MGLEDFIPRLILFFSPALSRNKRTRQGERQPASSLRDASRKFACGITPSSHIYLPHHHEGEKHRRRRTMEKQMNGYLTITKEKVEGKSMRKEN
jgi:hypothetical protein